MKIRKIEFENFRNFKEHGEIKCSVDGKVTIVYGKNGDGKTTLHQLEVRREASIRRSQCGTAEPPYI